MAVVRHEPELRQLDRDGCDGASDVRRTGRRIAASPGRLRPGRARTRDAVSATVSRRISTVRTSCSRYARLYGTARQNLSVYRALAPCCTDRLGSGFGIRGSRVRGSGFGARGSDRGSEARLPAALALPGFSASTRATPAPGAASRAVQWSVRGAEERRRRRHAITSDGGEFGFDGGTESRDACRAPLTRKSDGTSVNCGQSVRSRCLIKQ